MVVSCALLVIWPVPSTDRAGLPPCRPRTHARALRAAGACTRDPDRHNTLAVCSEQTGAHPATLRTWPQDGNARAERWWCAGSVRALAGRVAVSRQPPSTGFPFRKGAAPYHAARIHTARPASGGAVPVLTGGGASSPVPAATGHFRASARPNLPLSEGVL